MNRLGFVGLLASILGFEERTRRKMNSFSSGNIQDRYHHRTFSQRKRRLRARRTGVI
jgi:hypothetical protein